MDYSIPCRIKELPVEDRLQAATKAVEINPANARVTHMLRASAPDVVIPPDHLALLTAKYWGIGGVNLTVGFMDNPAADLKARILSHMNAWSAYCNAKFVETSSNPQVRISRVAGDGYWSNVGTDILLVAANTATMNLANFTMNTPDSEFFRVVRHETGHTLGFKHEHMRKEIVDRIDPAKAIAYFGGPPNNWSPAMVTAQVLTPLDASALLATAQADIHSIMCYSLPASIMKDGIAVSGGTDIDVQDSQFAASLYPITGSVNNIAANWHNMPAGFTGAFDAVLNGGGPFSGKCYFFKGDKYIRYDWATDKADPGYPKDIAANWHNLPAGFTSNFNTAVNGQGPFAGKCYFFKGNKYIRYDWATDKADAGYPKDIAANWHNLPAGFTDNFDACINGNGPFAGKLYFFKGNKYIRYDWATDKADPGYPKDIAANWHNLPAGFADKYDDAVEGDKQFIAKGYFFKGSNYVRYNWAQDRAE